MSANSIKKIEKIQKLYYLAYMCLVSAKNQNKKSHASVPLNCSGIVQLQWRPNAHIKYSVFSWLLFRSTLIK
jgi:hypothetical protein